MNKFALPFCLALALGVSSAFAADENILPPAANTKKLSPTGRVLVHTITVPLARNQPFVVADAAKDPNFAFAAFQGHRYLEAVLAAEYRAEKLNDAKAMTLLGEIYGEGLGVKRDLKKSFDWYQRAVKAGDVSALFAVGMQYMQGIGVKRDRDEGAKWLRRAADKGHAAAAYNLPLLYLEGQVFRQDFAEAAKLMRVAAEKDIPDAQHAMAIFHQEGQGVKQDLSESVRWLRRAAQNDHIPATVELAIAIFNGKGTDKDEQLGAQTMRRAALKGNPVAQNRLARMLLLGRGVEKNQIEAMAWHLLARSQNVSDPMLDDAFGDMKAEDKKKAEDILREWLRSRVASNT